VAKRVYYGGQAVVEGVMMRGRKAVVTAVRRSNGEIAMNAQSLSSIYTGWTRHAPLMRGIIVLVEAMILGIKALLYSANVSLEEEEEKVSGGWLWVVVAGALALAVGLFFVAPLYLARLIPIDSPILFNIVEGLIRVAIFIAYLKAMTLMPDIKRVFAYHGAEHKAVNAYEAGVDLEVEAVKEHDTAHPRCGTSFLFAVLVISVFVFALVGLPSLWLMVLSRIVLIPVIASLSYEIIYFSSRHSDSRLVRLIMAPGLWLQSLTTREPDDGQLEVALTALKKVMEIDRSEEMAQASS
jgi:uncharacterized protein YqhQ